MLATFVAVAVAVLLCANPFGARAADQFGIAIETPFVGQGVNPGTVLLMHGVKVGEITRVTSLSGGGVRLAADLQRAPTAGLTDTMRIDFRPANYFGVTGINLQPGDGGETLNNGSLVKITPSGNFTLQALLSRFGEISHDVLAPQLIDVIERATRYTDGLDPLLETVLVAANSLAKVQTVSTARLLANSTGISVAFPGLVNAAIEAGDVFLSSPVNHFTEDHDQSDWAPLMDVVAKKFFSSVGKLVSSHSTELSSLTGMIKVLTDVVPGLVPPDAIADTARELRLRLERLFAGPPDRRAVNVRVVLDSLPGIAAPIDAVGGAP